MRLNLLKIESMKMDPPQRTLFREFADYKFKTSKRFSYMDFNKMCRVSRKQWDIFRFENKELKEIKWIID